MTVRGLAQLLVDTKDEIVSRFVAGVEEADVSPPRVARSFIADHLPRFLDAIAATLAEDEVVALISPNQP